jgi:hypothetical protein
VHHRFRYGRTVLVQLPGERVKLFPCLSIGFFDGFWQSSARYRHLRDHCARGRLSTMADRSRENESAIVLSIDSSETEFGDLFYRLFGCFFRWKNRIDLIV